MIFVFPFFIYLNAVTIKFIIDSQTVSQEFLSPLAQQTATLVCVTNLCLTICFVSDWSLFQSDSFWNYLFFVSFRRAEQGGITFYLILLPMLAFKWVSFQLAIWMATGSLFPLMSILVFIFSQCQLQALSLSLFSLNRQTSPIDSSGL